jgi:hypothetical protein
MGTGGDAERYKNVNPFTEQAQGYMTGAYDQFSGAAGNTLTNFNQMLGNVPSVTAMMVDQGQFGNFDLSQLTGAENAFTGALDRATNRLGVQNLVGQLGQLAPFLQNLAGPGSGYINNQLAQAQQAGNQGLAQAMQGLSAGGNVWSGAGAAAASEAMVNPMLQAQGNIFNTANQNYMGLLGQGMGLLGQGNQALANLAMQRAAGLTDVAGLGLQAQQAGQGLQQQAALANQQAGLQAGMANQGAALDQANMLGQMHGQQIGGMTSALGGIGQMGQRETIYEPTWWERVGSDLVGGAMDLAGNFINPIGGLLGNLDFGGFMQNTMDNWGGGWRSGQPGSNVAYEWSRTGW